MTATLFMCQVEYTKFYCLKLVIQSRGQSAKICHRITLYYVLLVQVFLLMSLNFESRDEILIGHWVDLVYDYKTPFKSARLTICQFCAPCKMSSQIIEIRKVFYLYKYWMFLQLSEYHAIWIFLIDSGLTTGKYFDRLPLDIKEGPIEKNLSKLEMRLA